jgi:hypothetical protein
MENEMMIILFHLVVKGDKIRRGTLFYRVLIYLRNGENRSSLALSVLELLQKWPSPL